MTSTSPAPGRVIRFAERPAAENMAIDEALLQSVANGSPATLRFYGWSTPTLSLGYFQSHQEAAAWLDQPVAIVRRSTGGGAILHHHELTYSLVLPMQSSDTGARLATYRSVHQGIVDTLREWKVVATAHRQRPVPERALGTPARPGPAPFLCFERRTDEDLIVAGYKIFGSAQRRTRGALLQHGSLLLSVSAFAAGLPGIAELTGLRLNRSALAEQLTARLADCLTIGFDAAALTPAEMDAAATIQTERFANVAWTQRR